MSDINDFISTLAQPTAQPNIPAINNVPAPVAPVVQQPSFLDNLTNPTGNSLFLLDLASRITQSPQVGQSPFSSVLGGATEAVSGLAGRKAAAGESERQATLDAATLASSEASTAATTRTTESADINDELTRARIEKLRQEAKGVGKGKGGLPAAAIQVRTAKVKTLRAQHPDTFKTDSAAEEFVDRQDFVDKVQQEKTKALADYRTANELFFANNPEGMTEALAGVGKPFDDLIAEGTFVKDPEVPSSTTGAVAGAPTGAVTVPTTREELLAGVKTAGVDGLEGYLTSIGIKPSAAQLSKLRQEAGFASVEAKAPTTASTKVERKKPLSVEERKARREKRREGVKNLRETKRNAASTKRADLVARKESVVKELTETFPSMSKREMTIWIRDNRKHLTSLQIRRASKMKRENKG